MPIRLESDLERRVVKAAEEKGWWALKLVCVGHRGFPDRWFIRGGEHTHQEYPEIIIIEFKRVSKRVTKLQEWVCKKLEDVGFEVWWNVEDYEQAKKILGL